MGLSRGAGLATALVAASFFSTAAGCKETSVEERMGKVETAVKKCPGAEDAYTEIGGRQIKFWVNSGDDLLAITDCIKDIKAAHREDLEFVLEQSGIDGQIKLIIDKHGRLVFGDIKESSERSKNRPCSERGLF